MMHWYPASCFCPGKSLSGAMPEPVPSVAWEAPGERSESKGDGHVGVRLRVSRPVLRARDRQTELDTFGQGGPGRPYHGHACSRSILLASILFLWPTAARGQEPATQTILFKPAEEVLLNPGKGWVLYGSPADQGPETLALATVGYARFGWADVEPQEGKFRWESIDAMLGGWKKAGKQFAFGVMCASSHGPLYTTPKWVFDAGAKYQRKTISPEHEYAGTLGDKIVPQYDDPVFLAKLKAFIRAMGRRYDGNPNLAFVDIRSYGNWGEGHLFPFGGTPISAESLRQHVRMHLDAFKTTRLVLPWGMKDYEQVYDWAVAQGIGLRRDGICGNSNGQETVRCLGRVPAVFEFFGSYEFLKQRGWWDGKTANGCGYRLSDSVERGCPSYISMSQWGRQAQTFLAAERPLIERLANRMGYHFVITQAEVPRRLRRGQSVAVKLTWENRGVAYIYVPCRVAFALLDDRSRVVSRAWATGSDPRAWAPGKTVKESLSASFDDLPEGARSSRLAVGLYTDPKAGVDQSPAIALGIEGGTPDRWYPLACVECSN
jgi:hypothetical protein